jgi:peptidoglycan glycosyltransferase
MKKLDKRAYMCLALSACLFLGVCFYIGKVLVFGSTWVSYPANQHIFTDSKISTGSVYDVNGELLMKNTESGIPDYNEDITIRKALLHATGDNDGNIITGANKAFAGRLVGYNILSGTYSAKKAGRQLYLSLDAKVCTAAYKALNGRSGTVGVYNYETGEIICMVSSPTYDPANPPTLAADDTSGVYLNRFTSVSVVPGSIFKLVTAAAAIEEIPDLSSWTYTCTGELPLGTAKTDRVTCPSAHGEVNFEEALAVSCNCGFANLSLILGNESIQKYTEKAGLTHSYSINGIQTAKGSFEYPDNQVTLAWTGIGQNKDLVNPCSMMVYMGAIANGGTTAVPRLINTVKFSNGLPAGWFFSRKTNVLIEAETATKLESMMHNNVLETYGENNFPGLDLCAKSGTAEVGGNKASNAWFTGFVRNEGYPYAFIVLVENGGSGSGVAGKVANTVLQEIVNNK